MLAGNEIATYRLLHKVPILVFLHLHHLSFRLPRRLPHLCVCVCVCVCVRARAPERKCEPTRLPYVWASAHARVHGCSHALTQPKT